jgi:glyoxylase-like metal-dependent hydrolase (beta-lactamase superfamily II)
MRAGLVPAAPFLCPLKRRPMLLEPVYPIATPPATGTTFAVAPGVHWLRMPLPFALNHINLYVLKDDAGLCIVDTGYALDEVKAGWKSVLATLAKPVSRIIVTHFHPDHLGLAAWLEDETGAPVAMTMGEYLTARMIWHQVDSFDVAAMVALFRRHGLGDAACRALEQRGNAYRIGVPALPAHYRRLVAGQVLSIGGRDWQVIIGRGHAVEHAALYSAAAGVLLSGDMLLPRITSNVTVYAQSPDDDTLGHYLDSLAAFEPLPEDTLVLPAHGLPFRNLHGRIAAIRLHHRERLDLLESACDTPRTAAELLPVLFGRKDFDPHQHMFAMGESIAHINHLCHAGRLSRRLDGTGVFRFTRTSSAVPATFASVIPL